MTPNKITFTLTRKKKPPPDFSPTQKDHPPPSCRDGPLLNPHHQQRYGLGPHCGMAWRQEGRVDPFPMGFLWVSYGFPSRIHWKTHLSSQEFGRRTRWRKFSNWFTDEGHKRCLLLRQIRQFSVSGTLTGPDSCHPVQGQPCCSVSTGAFKDSRSADMKIANHLNHLNYLNYLNHLNHS